MNIKVDWYFDKAKKMAGRNKVIKDYNVLFCFPKKFC